MDNTSNVKSDPDPLVDQVDFDNWPDYTNDEDVVNKYFYKLYVSQITTDQMIEVMRHLSASPKGSRNKSVYNTMIKILFNECRFFPKYPLQELSITAELFGKMIKHGLLLSNGPLLLLASRCILEALKRGKTSKMFQFGTIALSQFENSIASYPWFSNSLLSIPDVKETFPQLYKTCEKLQTIMTDNMKNSTYIDQSKGIVIGQVEEVTQTQPEQNGQTSPPSYGLDIRASVGEWELIMGDVEVDATVPPDSLVDHVYSIFNNMCPDDVEKKATEVSALLDQKYNTWLLLYIIRTRASKEHNLHDVFANFIENMNYPKLFDQAIQITYLCINSCLKNVEQHKEVLAYRTLLKNLGSWLGRITLSRNVPIIHRQLDVKTVLTKGYENGYLVVVLPFICKSMESIKNSKIFKPPNPWTTAMLSFLMEIRDLPNLKTNLVFEVEVLFKHLNLEMKDYANKTNLLTSKNPPKNSPDFEPPNPANTVQTTSSTTTKTNGVQAGTNTLEEKNVQYPGDREKLNQLLSKIIREGTLTTSSSKFNAIYTPDVPTNLNNVVTQTTNNAPTKVTNTVPTGGSPSNVTTTPPPAANLPTTANFAHAQINMSMTRFIDNMMHNLHNNVVISPSIALFEIQPQFRSLVPIAVERAVRHVLSVVCEHSLSLARMCTKVIIAKDFSNQEDENVTRGATRMMFETLATNLVVATCKEPLKVAFHESLRSSIQTHRTQDCNDQVLVEQLVQVLSQDNLAVCVNVVEKITQEYAIRESDLLFMEILKPISREPKLPTNFLPTLINNWNTRNNNQHALVVYKSIFGNSRTTPQRVQLHSPSSVSQHSIQSQQFPVNQMNQQFQGQVMMGQPPISSPANQMPTSSLQQSSPNGLHTVLTLFEECLSELREPLREISMFPPPLYNTGLEPGKTEHIFSTQSLHVLYSLPHDHEVFSCIIKCLNVVETSGCREVASMAIAKCLLMFLCEGLGSNAGLNVEVLLCILDGLNSINPAVKQMLGNMLYSLPLDQNNNLFNIIVVTGLLRYKLLEWSELTHYLILAMERGKNVYAIEMSIVATAIALIDQKSAPPTVGAPLVREISSLSCGLEPCKTYPGVLIKDAWSKLLKDIVDVQNEPKPTILVLTTILKQNLNTLFGIHHFKTNPSTQVQVGTEYNDQRSDDQIDGFGGARRVPIPSPVNDSHRFVFGALFGKWVECSKNVEGDSLLLSWRQFFQKFNLQSLFKMEGGTDSFFSSCLYTIIHFEKTSKLFNMANKDPNNQKVNGLTTMPNMRPQASTNTSSMMTSLNASNDPSTKSESMSDESNTNSSASSSASSSSAQGLSAPPITLFDCLEGLCKMIDVMLRLVGGVGDIPPCSALQKLLSSLSSIIVHQGHYLSSYNIWLSLMVYFDRYEEPNYVYAKLTFLYALEYINPTRVPGFSFFFMRLLVHPALINGSLRSTKCWRILSRIFNLLSIYTADINNYPNTNKESNENKDLVIKEDSLESEKDTFRDIDNYVEYFTSVYFNCVEHVSNLCPEFVSINYLNFFGTFAIERLASSVGNKGPSVLKGFLGVKGVDVIPEMKVAPKVSNSWSNHISRNRLSLLVTKVLTKLSKFGLSSLVSCQDLETICLILTEQVNNTPAQSVMTFNSLTLEIVTTHPNVSQDLHDTNARLFLFLWLIKALPIKAKYQLVCSIVRHLRDPNAHTFFFSCLIITMFDECKNDLDTKHVILRVLLESFIAPGKCPWGVSLVVLELFTNPRFQQIPNYSPQTNALIESITHTINNIAT
uniref:CCR4-NOT transcription complex subunit 1 n=1 Tax=Theileria annulata TaxID=5874 RepID=A0A3B0MJV3_THEAN